MLDHDFELISTASVYDGPEDQQGRKTGRSPAVQGHYGAFANTDAALRENRWSLCTTCRQDGRIYRSGNHAQAKALFIFAPARWPTTTATSSSTSS